MAAKVGHPKYGGRKKGSKNKKTEELFEICARKKLTPFEALIDLALSTDDEGIKLGALKELCQYLYPKRKAVEVSSPEDSALNVNTHSSDPLVQALVESVTGYKNERNQK